MRAILIATTVLLCLIHPAISQRQDGQVLYETDFQQIGPGSLPQEFKVLSGEFAVREEGTNRYLELGVGHLNSFGMLLGPERNTDTSIRARVRSLPTGKRFPEFGIGLGGVGGYQLWLMPAVGELQLRQGGNIIARTPFSWKPGAWIRMHLKLEKSGDAKWLVRGRIWMDGVPEPTDWTIHHESTSQPPNGRASLWGTPYSEKPIQFDDLSIQTP